MRLTVVSLLLAGFACAVPLEAVEDAAAIESRAGGPDVDPHLFIVGTPYTSGTGCPKGTANVTYDKDAQTITVNFDVFQVATGPAPLTADKSAKGCKLTVSMTYDQGYTYVMEPSLENDQQFIASTLQRLSFQHTV
jgi:hypothetical protein